MSFSSINWQEGLLKICRNSLPFICQFSTILIGSAPAMVKRILTNTVTDSWLRNTRLFLQSKHSSDERGQRTLPVASPYRGSPKLLHLLINNTSIKGEGEGEWNACKNGRPKQLHSSWHTPYQGHKLNPSRERRSMT